VSSVDRRLRQRTDDVRDLEKQLTEERSRHATVVQELNTLIDKFKPGQAKVALDSQAPSGKQKKPPKKPKTRGQPYKPDHQHPAAPPPIQPSQVQMNPGMGMQFGMGMQMGMRPPEFPGQGEYFPGFMGDQPPPYYMAGGVNPFLAPLGPMAPMSPMGTMGPMNPMAQMGPMSPMGPMTPMTPMAPMGPPKPALPNITVEPPRSRMAMGDPAAKVPVLKIERVQKDRVALEIQRPKSE
jgi:hypothetical protein